MGNKNSSLGLTNEKDPYKILNADVNDNIKDIKKKYSQMLLKYHPTRNKDSSDEKVIEIKNAYQQILENIRNNNFVRPERTINLDDYDENYFKNLKLDFYSTVDKLFTDICEAEKFKNFPSFGNENTKNHYIFYEFFSKFNTQRIFSKNPWENKSLQGQFNSRLKRIIKAIEKCDPRLEKKIISEKPFCETYEIKQKAKKKKNKVKTGFDCDICSKTFKTRNQILSHLNTKKHALKVMNIEKDYTKYIQNEIKIFSEKSNFESQAASEKNSDDSSEELEKKIVLENEKKLLDFYKKIDELKFHNSAENVKEAENEKPLRKSPDISYLKSSKTKVEKKRFSENSTFQRESIHFLTCGVCKERFESRDKLFMHLKSDLHKS